MKTFDFLQAADIDRARLEFVLRQLDFKCFKLVDGTGKEIWDVLMVWLTLSSLLLAYYII